MIAQLLYEFFLLESLMQKLFSPASLRAAAVFVIVLDQHPVGAGVFLVMVLAVALARGRSKRR